MIVAPVADADEGGQRVRSGQIVVLGMHRSGTSCIAGSLAAAGAYAGEQEDLTGVNEENPRGFWERKDMRRLCDALLHSAGNDWWKVSDFLAQARSQESVESARTTFRSVLDELGQHEPWVIKEPRLCLLLPAILPLLRDPICVHIYRNPLEVAESLRKRNAFTLHEGIALWEFYNQMAIRNSQGVPVLRLSYNALVRDPKRRMQGLIKRLEASGVAGLRAPGQDDLDQFVDPALRRQRVGSGGEDGFLTRSQMALWECMRSPRRLDADSIPDIADSTLEALRDLEFSKEIFDRSELLGQKEEKIADLQRRLESTNRQRAEATAQAAGLHEEAVSLKQQLAVLDRDRSHLESSLDAAGRASDELDRKLSASEKRSAELGAGLAAAEARYEELRRHHELREQEATSLRSANAEQLRRVLTLEADLRDLDDVRKQLGSAREDLDQALRVERWLRVRLQLMNGGAGRRAGRNPLTRWRRRRREVRQIAGSELFDHAWYASQAGLGPRLRRPAAAAHFAEQGAWRGLDPGPRFSTLDYALEHEDVLESGMNPFLHFLRYGRREGRESRDSRARVQAPDGRRSAGAGRPGSKLGLLFGDASVVAWVAYCGRWKLRRRAVLAAQANGRAAGVRRLAAGLPQRALAGLRRRLGRGLRNDVRLLDQTGFVDVAWYRRTYPDVAAAGLSPARHYLEHGASEGRNPNSWFDTETYLTLNPDVRISQVNPAVHYLRYGREEGRSIARADSPDHTGPAEDGPIALPDGVELHMASSPKALPDLFALRVRQSQASCLVVAHAADPDQLLRAADAATACENADLLITTTRAALRQAAPELSSCEPPLTLAVYPDGHNGWSALMHLVNAGLVWKYQLLALADLTEAALTMLRGDVDRGVAARFERDADLALCGAAFERVPEELQSEVDGHLALFWARLGRDGDSPRARQTVASPLWIRPFLLRHAGAAGVSEAELADRAGSDGAAAAMAFNGLLIRLAQDAGMTCSTTRSPGALRTGSARTLQPKVVAFYLPQFHPIPENDLWWGSGFTEWNNVTRGRQFFRYHWQPRVPAELGYYDLRVPETRAAQADLARRYGLHGFCYYYYWFNGRKLLETPIESVFRSGKPDLPFCICWANENWTRNWDGHNRHILLEQSYSLDGNREFIREMIPMMKDPRYIRHGGKPVLAVYRISAIPDWVETADMWRAECRKAGVGEIHLCAVRFTLEPLEGPPERHGLDAYVMFLPHESRRKDIQSQVVDLRSPFHGELFSYDAVVDGDVERFEEGYPWPVHRGCMLGWDNTARRGASARVFHGATPARFRYWMKSILDQEQRFGDSSEPLIFVNAWNEWAEGAVLEPEKRYGRGFLEAVESAVGHGTQSEL